jgi:serine/threonine protein kinase
MKPPHSEGDDDVDDLDEIVKAVARAPAVAPPPRSDATDRRLGTVLRGKYRLEEVLGVGGMAIVYRATHRNQAEYAIKMLLPEHAANEDLRIRFLREGYAANSVKHPGAVRVVDDDVAEDGTAFLVLELLDGLSCDKLCTEQGGRLSVEAACAIGLQALDVLQSAHVNGIIHRDIKPANLFLLRNGEIKVLDFGIARVRETLATGAHTTGSGMLLGTPAFMAPEQAMGKASEVDARADIWAIGATLFAMISGLTVHEGDSGRELIVKLVTRPTRSLLTIVPEIPQALAAVVDRALAVDRESRWPTAAAMRDGLEKASHQLWKERSQRDVLAFLGQSIASGPRPNLDAISDSEKKKKASPVHEATPTLRAQESPELLEVQPRASAETERPVSHLSHGGSLSLPRRRVTLFGILASLAVGAVVAVIAAVSGRSSPMAGSPAAPTGAAPQVAVSAVGTSAAVAAPLPAMDSASSPTDSEGARATGDVPPDAASLVLPPDARKPVRTRGVPRQDRGAPLASAAPSPLVHAPSSSPVVASPSTQVLPAASDRPAAAPNCTPPFYYDSKMNRVFKRECL